MPIRFFGSPSNGSDAAEADQEVPTTSIGGRISEFDLPIEFHENSIKTWVIAGKIGQDLLRQLKRVIDPKRQSRFEAVNPNILLKALTSRRNFNYVREIAALRVEVDALKQLRMFSKDSSCVFNHDAPFAKSVFSWYQTDFVQRRQEDLNWIGLLEAGNSEHCLTALKFQFDIREILQHVILIFDHLLPLPENIGMEQLTKMLEHEENHLHIEEALIEELENSTEAYERTVRRRLASMRASDGARRRIYLKKKTMDYEMLNTIETRFQLRHLKDKVEQSECLAKKSADDLQRQIDDFTQEMFDMEHIHGCNMDVQNKKIRDYRKMLAEFTEDYDKKSAEIDDQVTVSMLSIDKLKLQRRFLEEEIQRFHDEIAEYLAQKKLLEEEEEARSLLSEQLRLQKLKKKEMAEKAKSRKSNISNISNRSNKSNISNNSDLTNKK